MSGCSDCFGSAKEVQTTMSTVQKKAKEFAVEKNSLVVLYKDDSGMVQYMLADKARQIGIMAIAYISPIVPV